MARRLLYRRGRRPLPHPQGDSVAVVPAGLADGLFTDLPEEKGFFFSMPAAWCDIGGKRPPSSAGSVSPP